jgi:Uma2 family endonuclease
VQNQVKGIWYNNENSIDSNGGVLMMTEDKSPKRMEQLKEQQVTYDDYAKLPDDGMRYEINDGKLEAMTPGPNALHQLVVQQVAHRLMQMCQDRFVIFTSPIDVILSETEVRQPDVVMIHRDRLSIVTKRGIEGTPDLVIEVLSPFSAKRDRLQKLRAYARYSIPEYWIVDINNELLEQYILKDQRYELVEVYREDELVHSEQIACASFSMQEIMDSIPELPNF